MCCLQQKEPGYDGTTRSFNYDQSMHYIITGQLIETPELNLIKDGNMSVEELKSKLFFEKLFLGSVTFWPNKTACSSFNFTCWW